MTLIDVTLRQYIYAQANAHCPIIPITLVFVSVVRVSANVMSLKIYRIL